MNAIDPLLGTLIDGRYTIHARIARGGMASVYRATDSRLGRDVAIKFIHPHLAEQNALVARFIKEARSAASLYSPHIVTVYDQGVAHLPDGTRAYLVMELITGPNLRAQFNALGSFTLGQAFDLACQILTALSIAHSKGIIHRDVKPENILLTEALDQSHPLNKTGVVAKVADFGLAKAATDSSSAHTTSMLGTVGYIAPEIVTHQKTSPASDVYSVGIMLYEFLAGQLPFTGTSPVSIAYSHVNDPVPRLSDLAPWIPVSVDSLISLFTAKDPLKRPRSGTEALDALTDVFEGLPEELLLRRIPVFPVNRTTEEPRNLEKSEALVATHFLTPTNDAHAPDIEPMAETGLLPDEFKPKLSDGNAFNQSSGAGVTSPSSENRAPSSQPRRRWPIVVVLLAVLLGAAGFGVHWWFASGPGLRVTVNNVAGQSTQQATDTLKKAGFTVKTDHAFSDDVPRGNVIETDPKAGSKIHPSNPVTIIVSDGVEILTVPNVVAQEQAQAEDIIKKSRFTAKVTQAWSDSVAKGKVISQEPIAGASATHDSEVTIVISQGREPVKVPKVVGLNSAQAQEALTKAGLKVEISEEYSSSIPPGQVVSQSPDEGTGRYKNDSVKISVSKGPQPVKVPDVFGKQEKDAVKTLKDAGFNVEVERILGGIFGTVRAQNPGADEMVQPGSTIKIKVV
ncbi:Stk1 family PASTA domain-containing Ser/Thr kinase [Arcanobacterium ihumii]|uniref:Stk1 family PASTA domain-containing Ser/Thr kinase n=1 Tax=Arcanobacterium ihumii TaxID=2138162 RepID=UPI000F54B068|nr:Stk1 family PASTA domain-containing Ser/Thr kinase [Arcanobacterium ihumii]